MVFLKSLSKTWSGIKCKGLHKLSCLWGSCFIIPTEILEFFPSQVLFPPSPEPKMQIFGTHNQLSVGWVHFYSLFHQWPLVMRMNCYNFPPKMKSSKVNNSKHWMWGIPTDSKVGGFCYFFLPCWWPTALPGGQRKPAVMLWQFWQRIWHIWCYFSHSSNHYWLDMQGWAFYLK